MLGKIAMDGDCEDCVMPATYQINKDIVWVTCSENYLFDELSEAILSAIADPEYSSKIPLLIDYRAYSGNTPMKNVIARANFLGTLQGKIPPVIALLASDSLHYALGRMLQAHASKYGFQIETFLSSDEAIEFLRLNNYHVFK